MLFFLFVCFFFFFFFFFSEGGGGGGKGGEVIENMLGLRWLTAPKYFFLNPQSPIPTPVKYYESSLISCSFVLFGLFPCLCHCLFVCLTFLCSVSYLTNSCLLSLFSNKSTRIPACQLYSKPREKGNEKLCVFFG